MPNQEQPKIPKESAHETWRKLCNDVTEAMKVHTRPFVLPLSTESEREVRQVGTGSFLCWKGSTVLLTCEHVSSEGPLNLSSHGSDDVFAATQPFVDEKSLDAAFVPVGDAEWAACKHDAQAIPAERFAAKHMPSHSEELFFFHGFAGENSHYAFGTLESSASAYVTQQSADAMEDDRIFELLWEPQQTTFVESTPMEVRKAVRFANPGGFSGSLVWNTRYMEVTSFGQKWTPDCALVSGLLRRWDTNTKTLLVVRVEHLRNWLDAMVPSVIRSTDWAHN